MKQKKLGQTELVVSQIGLGTVKFGRNQGVKYPTHFELPSDRSIQELLFTTEQSGINLLDTAPAYGSSEERLGKLLGNNRHQWVLCSKVGENYIDGESTFDFSKSGIRLSVERSLKLLKTDYLDIILVHSDGNDKEIIDQNVFATLAELKIEGKIRAYGMSTKTIEGGMLAVDQSDVVMVTYNPLHTEEQPVIAYAHKNNKGIFIKKALASGHLNKIDEKDPVKKAIQFINQEPGVSSIILGTINPTHLIHAVNCLQA